MIRQWQVGVVALIALVCVSSASPVYSAEGTARASASWHAQGRIFQVQDKLALFVGVFEGIMFIETGQGALDAAKLLCPGLLEVNLNDGQQSGEGRCILTSRNDERVYATWRCAGEHMVGCKGTFTLHGGTGKFAGITGNSEFLIRSDMAEYVANIPQDKVEVRAVGIAVWPALTYKLP